MPSTLQLERLRESPDLIWYRGHERGNASPVLAVVLKAQQPSLLRLRRFEHEHSLADELDAAWAAKPIALTRYEERTALLLFDPGGEPLDLLMERNRGKPLQISRAADCRRLGERLSPDASARAHS